MPKTFYLTTPLYYVNAAPHIGHSYTNIAADALARYQRLKGRDVFFLTGTDEHGQKIQQAAVKAGQTPQAFADAAVAQFTALWTRLSISHDDFIRTSQPRHVQTVQALLQRLYDAKRLVRASYRGWYCTPDETFWTDAELTGSTPTCPACSRALEPLEEEGWHLPLRASQEWLKRFVASHPTFVRPVTRCNELKGLLEQPLPESLCITRPKARVSWGIPVPFSPDHVTYVWFDALINYISVPGVASDPARFKTVWPADVHFIGKDILRHHAVSWPIMLHALGFTDEQMPQAIVAHGWWKIGEQKMSKSLGNIVDPTVVITQVLKGQPFAADIYRYFLLREIPFGQDGNFSEDALAIRLSKDLANDLGNLVNRTLSMLGRYRQGRLPSLPPVGCAVEDEPLKQAATELPARVDAALGELEFSSALEAIMTVVSRANQYIEVAAPWKLAKDAQAAPRLDAVLRTLAEVIRIVAVTLEPFMPSVATSIWSQLGCGAAQHRWADAARWPGLADSQPINQPTILFPNVQNS